MLSSTILLILEFVFENYSLVESVISLLFLIWLASFRIVHRRGVLLTALLLFIVAMLFNIKASNIISLFSGPLALTTVGVSLYVVFREKQIGALKKTAVTLLAVGLFLYSFVLPSISACTMEIRPPMVGQNIFTKECHMYTDWEGCVISEDPIPWYANSGCNDKALEEELNKSKWDFPRLPL